MSARVTEFNNEEMDDGPEVTFRQFPELYRRINELECWRYVSRLTEQQGDLPQLLQQLIEEAPRAFQHPQFTGCRLVLDKRAYASVLFCADAICADVPLRLRRVTLGRLQVSRRMADAGSPPLPPDEQTLVRLMAEKIVRLIDAVQHRDALQDSPTRSLVELDLARARDYLRTLYEASPDMIFIHAADGRVLEVNENAWRNYGYASAATMLAQPFERFTSGDCTLAQAQAYLAQALTGAAPDFEWTARRADGTQFPVEVRLRRLANADHNLLEDDAVPRPAIVAVVRDITARKQQEMEALAAKSQLQATIDAVPDLLFELGLDGRYHGYHCPRTDLLAMPVEALLGRMVSDVLPPDAAGVVMEALHEAHEKSFSMGKQFELQLPQGKLWFELSISRKTTDPAYEPRFIVLSRDITKRKKTELALETSKVFFSTLADISPVGIFRSDAEGHCIYINSRIWEMTGMPPDDIYTRGWEQAIHPDDRAAVVAQWYGCIAKRQTFNMEYRYQRPNGAVRWVLGQAMAEWNNQGEMIGYVGTITDITDTKNMQEELCLSFIAREQAHTELKLTHDQLLQSEKMASIGQLAAGVAHEINNPVGYIASNIGSLKHYLSDLFRLLDAQEMALAKLPKEDSLRQLAEQFRSRVELPLLRKDIFELIGECKEGIGRVKKIVQSLKDFSRVSQDEWLRVDIHEILEKALNIVCNELKYKAEVVREYGELPTVECLPVQLSQVFMNLLLNGAQAIAERGTIIIRTGRDGDERVWVEIEDSGAGIAAEHLTRIFEPFFTTKPVGKGTGLGLSVAYNIVQAHGGRITVDSRQGAGSRFKVVIPVSRKLPA